MFCKKRRSFLNTSTKKRAPELHTLRSKMLIDTLMDDEPNENQGEVDHVIPPLLQAYERHSPSHAVPLKQNHADEGEQILSNISRSEGESQSAESDVDRDDSKSVQSFDRLAHGIYINKNSEYIRKWQFEAEDSMTYLMEVALQFYQQSCQSYAKEVQKDDDRTCEAISSGTTNHFYLDRRHQSSQFPTRRSGSRT